MRRLLISGASCLVLAGAAGAQFFDPPALQDRNGSQGFEFYMLEVPNPASMKIDGFSDDCGWFDPEYTLTMDEWRDEGDRPAPDRSDLNVTTFMGWKGGENKWYTFMEIVDDVLAHDGTSVERWSGDMLQVGIDPQDHGRQRNPAVGYTMEWLMAPGDLSPPTNVRFRFNTAGGGRDEWLAYGEEPWMDFAVRVDPPEAWAASVWTDGGTTYYEWAVNVLAFQEDSGPAASQEFDMNAASGANGQGIGFAFWVEDGEGPGSCFDETKDAAGTVTCPGGSNDWTTRGPEASSRQYYSHALLLKGGEFATAVESSTWGNIKNSFR